MVEAKSASLFTTKRDVGLTPDKVKRILGITLDRTDHLPIERENLFGKVALITGSSRGIGAATGRLFGEYRMKVVVNSRNSSKEQGEQVVEDIIKAGGEAIWIPADVTKEDEAKRLIENTYRQFNRLDVVVNNVGTTDDSLLIKMTQDQWHKLFSVNVDSAFFVTKHAISRMIRQKPPGGMIIFNSSIGAEGLPGQANYAASKRAMEGLAEVAAREYSSRKIYTSIIRPGFVETELTTNLKPEQRQAILALSPAGRPFTPEEIARGITYLATLTESGHIMNVF